MRPSASVITIVTLACTLGCGGGESTEAPPAQTATAAAPPPPAPAAPGDGTQRPAPMASEEEAPPEAAAPEASAPIAEPAAPAEAMPDESGAPEADVAAVGAGKKGRDYGGPGLVTTPVQAYFQTLDRIAFEVQIPKAMQLYKASHNNKGPKTHEEFMDVIIKENAVQLPELPAGDEYFYDPATEQLMIRHPARDGEPSP